LSIAAFNAPKGLREYQERLRTEESNEGRRDIIIQAIRILYGFEPRAEQIDCIEWLLYKKMDLIFMAKTSFDKSLMMQALPCLVPDSIILVILPLLALGFE
jgi:hypothetical protein